MTTPRSLELERFSSQVCPCSTFKPAAKPGKPWPVTETGETPNFLFPNLTCEIPVSA